MPGFMTFNTNKKILAIGDVHGNFQGFSLAMDYAKKNDLFPIFLGDLVDYGQNSDLCAEEAIKLVRTKRALFIRGNHDRKMQKYFKQKLMGKVTVQIEKEGHQATIKAFEKNSKYKLLATEFIKFVDQCPFILAVGNNIFVHGAIHPSFWTKGMEKETKVETYALFGEVDHSAGLTPEGFPVRRYNWVEHIPVGVQVFIGHDCMPEVKVVESSTGGRMIHCDTGSGKDGVLSGVIISGTKLTTVTF